MRRMAARVTILWTFLAYDLFWYIFPSGLEGGVNPYAFPLAITIAEEVLFMLVIVAPTLAHQETKLCW